MAKGNKKAIVEANINKGFDELIKTFDQVADGSEREMPLLSSAMRHSIAVVKLYKEAFNVTNKRKQK